MGNGSIPRFRNLISPKVSSEAVHFIGAKASGCPSWPGVIDSTKGRIHWRRPTAKLVSLATRRRTIHGDNPTCQDLAADLQWLRFCPDWQCELYGTGTMWPEAYTVQASVGPVWPVLANTLKITLTPDVPP